jgi:HD-like signal output (HDOD) protein
VGKGRMKLVQEFDIVRFYEKCLVPMTPDPIISKALHLVMSGGETSEDFAKLLAMDTELQHWVRLTVQRLGFDKHASKLLQAIILLGQNRIRDLMIGRHLERTYYSTEESLLGKLLKEREMAKEESKNKKDSKNSPPAATITDTKTDTKAESNEIPAEDTSEEAEIIPPLADFATYLNFASRAEEIAVSIRNSYPGQAYAGGVIFDIVHHHLKHQKLDGLEDPRLKNTDNYLEEVFKDGIRCGIAANEIMQKISIPHQRNVFVSALVHNIGKPLLLIYDPIAFQKAFLNSTGSQEKKHKISSEEAEDIALHWDHAQAGSLFVGRLPFLAEIERSIDYHHNPHLLRFANPKLYALACVLRVSGALAKLYQINRQEDPDIEQIRDQKLRASEDFSFLRLTEEDWADIKSNYALKLMKVGY